MKYNYIVITILLTIFILLAGCGNNTELQESNLSSAEASFNDVNELEKHLYVPEADIEFLDFINNNPIDTSYHNEFPDTGIIGNMAAVESKYADIWQTEMKYSYNSLAQLLSDEDAEHLLELQQSWENAVIGTITFEQEQLITDSYNVKLGSIYEYTKISAYLNAYRERTIHIKYLQYIIERAEKPNLPFKELSLKFSYHT